jgi:hypothetical protein
VKWRPVGYYGPHVGDRREWDWFAWYPVRCEDGFVRWLEWLRVSAVWASDDEGFAQFWRWKTYTVPALRNKLPVPLTPWTRRR